MLKESGITLKEALEMDCLKGCKLIAGFEGYNNVITRVNIMADPYVIDWVSEGELLLTTAYFFKTSSLEEQVKFIKELSKKKLSGIAIKVFPYLEKLPKEILDLANGLKFPIIELNYQIPFADIMTPIFMEIFNKQVVLLQKVENLHNNLMNILLTGGTVGDIVKTLSKVVGNPVGVINHYFEEFVYAETVYPFDYSQIEKKVRRLVNSNWYNNRLSSRYFTKIEINNHLLDIVMVPILVKNNIYGHIVVIAGQKNITSSDIVAAETASTVIAVESLKRISVREVENGYMTEFFEDLISLDNRRKNKAVERAFHYKFKKDALYNVVAINFIKHNSNIDCDYDFNQIKNKGIHIINRICKEEDAVFLIANRRDTVNILLMWKDGKNLKSKVNNIVRKIDHALKDRISFIKYRMGIGRIYKGLESVYRSVRDAEKALDAGKTYINASIIDFDELGVYKLFCHDNLKEELINFYRSTLEPLCEYDKKRDTELVKTLEAYFETNGNLKKMSERLYTHYNTILYRINRICEITGMNLEDEHDRFNLETALKIKKIIGIDR